MTKILSMVVVVTLAVACAASGDSGDWPYWRGAEQNGSCREKAAVTSWSVSGENLLWKSPIGGRSTPIVMAGRLYGVGPVGRGEATQERVFCLNADTGALIWEHRFNVFHTDIVENRVGWTSPVGDPETGNVYVHGTGGEMFCFDRDGRIVWKVSMTETLGRISGYGGRLHTPIVDEDRVIVSFLNSNWGDHARPLHRYVAFDKRNGAVQWWAAPGGKPLDTTYSSPVVTVIGGVRMLIAGNADGNVYGMNARTGERLWTFRLSKRGLNSSVVVDGKYAYIGHSEENHDNTEMGRYVCIDASMRGDITDSGEVWRFSEKTIGYASAAIARGRLYLVDNSGNLHCVDAKTGKPYWEYSIGRVGKGSPVVTADGVIYVGEQNGTFHILRDTGDKCVSLDKEEFKRDDGLVDEIYGSPAVCAGRVYFQTRYGTYALGTKGEKAQPISVPSMATESSAKATGTDRLMMVPAEVTLSPGERVRFTVKRFDAAGRFLVDERVPLTPTGLTGQMSADGSFTAASDNVFTAGYVVAHADGLEAKARVRISPSLPIREDFESMTVGTVPPGWVGVASKTKIVERDGGKVLKKLASRKRPNPPFMRLRAYATPPLEIGYTVQADMLSEVKKKRRRRYLPEMGLINNRYRFIMMRSAEDLTKTTLRIESWSPLPRVRKDVLFDWEPDTWYTVKFEVRSQGTSAVCRAKVWPRGETEPTDWQISGTDDHPNHEGSAGLYCYSTGTTAGSDGPATYFDNFQVIPNE